MSKEEVFALLRRNDFHAPKYLCFANAHTVTMAARDHTFRDATNQAWLCLPSGKPVSVLGNLLYGRGSFHRIFGPDFMAECLARSKEFDLTHFFYGSSTEVLQKLEAKYRPLLGSRWCGSLAPPFGPLPARELEEHFRTINQAGAKLIWIGLGAPRDHIFMRQNLHQLKYGLMAGVGAAFDFEAGLIKRAPRWMQECSLQWLYRLAQQPRRLWRRCLVSIPSFLYLAGCALLSRWFRGTSASSSADATDNRPSDANHG